MLRRFLSNRRLPRSGVSKPTLLFLAVITSILYTNIVRLSVSLPNTHVLAEASDSAPAPVRTTQTYSATTSVDTSQKQTSNPSCTGTSYGSATGLDLSAIPQGLHIATDEPTYYVVNGSSISDIRNAIQHCSYRAPAGTYHALTSYNLTWQYSIVVNGTRCSLKDTKVGMHITQLMPALNPNVTLANNDQTSWLNYITSLSAHEDGHVNIDQRYAKKLYTALESIGATDCAAIDATTKATINLYLQKMNDANTAYDAATKHGSTQGALL